MIIALVFTLLTLLLPFRGKEQDEEETPDPLPDSMATLNRLVEQLYRTDYGTPAFNEIEQRVNRLAEIYCG